MQSAVAIVCLTIAAAAAGQSSPPGAPDTSEGALAAIGSTDRAVRVAVLDRLRSQPDPRALAPLLALSRRRFANPDEREQSWAQIAGAAAQIARHHAIPAELAAFLRSLVDRPAEVRTISRVLEHRALVPKHPFSHLAREALDAIALRDADLALRAELEALPPEARLARVARAAWSPADPDPFRAKVARARLPELGRDAVLESRTHIEAARSEDLASMVDFFAAQYADAPDAAAGGLLDIAAIRGADPMASYALHRVAELRPPGAATAIVRILEEPAVPKGLVEPGLVALGGLGDPAAVPFAAAVLAAERASPRSEAARALSELGAPGLEALLAAVDRGPPDSRDAAAIVLAERTEPEARRAVWLLAESTADAGQRARLLWVAARHATPIGVDRAARAAWLRAIDRLGYEPDRWRADALEAISALLLAEPIDGREREEGWLHAARALRPLAFSLPVPDALLARVRVLAEREAERAPYPAAAAEAVRAVECARASCALGAFAATLSAEDRIAVLSALAWSDGPKAAAMRRSEARELLLASGPAGVSAARARFASAAPEAQRAMIGDWGRIHADTGDPVALEALLDATAAPDWEVAIRALDALPEKPVEGLAPQLVDRVRRGPLAELNYAQAVFETLARLGDPRAIPFLTDQLIHPNAYLARRAGEAMTRLGEDGRDVLIESSRSEDARIRRAAVGALGARMEGDRRARRAVRLALRAHPEDLESGPLEGWKP